MSKLLKGLDQCKIKRERGEEEREEKEEFY